MEYNCRILNYENNEVRSRVLKTINMTIVFWCERRLVWYRTTKVSEQLAASVFRLQAEGRRFPQNKFGLAKLLRNRKYKMLFNHVVEVLVGHLKVTGYSSVAVIACFARK
jgi:hypothetical protein